MCIWFRKIYYLVQEILYYFKYRYRVIYINLYTFQLIITSKETTVKSCSLLQIHRVNVIDCETMPKHVPLVPYSVKLEDIYMKYQYCWLYSSCFLRAEQISLDNFSTLCPLDGPKGKKNLVKLVSDLGGHKFF